MSLYKTLGLALCLSVLTACGGAGGTDTLSESGDKGDTNIEKPDESLTETNSENESNTPDAGDTTGTNEGNNQNQDENGNTQTNETRTDTNTDNESNTDDTTDTNKDEETRTTIPESDKSLEASGENFLQQFAIATQGSNYRNRYPAQNAIDGDPKTFNHTGCNAKDNWLQIAFPSSIRLSNLGVVNRSNNQDRLNGTRVYLSSKGYKDNDSLKQSEWISTLNGDAQDQSISPPIAKKGRYLIFKAEADNCLHISELTVKAELASAPQFTQLQASYLIPRNTAKGSIITSLKSIDYQGDSISYEIVSDAFEIDQQGNIRSKTDSLSSGAHRVSVIASDGKHQTVKTITIKVTEENAIETALKTGDALQVTSLELLEAARQELATIRKGKPLLAELYANNAIDYSPGNRTQIFSIKADRHLAFPILVGRKNKILALAGIQSQSRFAAFGMAPTELFANGKSLSYEAPFKRLLNWLLGEKQTNPDALGEAKTVALSFTKSDTSNIKDWLNKNAANWQIKTCDDVATLASCYDEADLVISGWQTDNKYAGSIKNTLQSITRTGTPVLYLHTWYEARNEVSQAIGEVFGFELEHGGNYWADDVARWDNASIMQNTYFIKLGYNTIDTMLQHFIDADYAFDWSRCDDEDCTLVPRLNSDFLKGASTVRSLVDSMDTRKLAVFTHAYQNQYRLEKLLVLIADKFRQNVTYPMDKSGTDDNRFLRSLYADHAVYNYRSHNPAQADMGNFSRSDFSAVTAVSKTVKLISKAKFRSTGVYALPGQAITITRKDTADVSVKVFINTLRPGATHHFASNGYKRPKYLQTPHIEIKNAETITLTSPYGGPVELEFNKNGFPVELHFEHVGEHPYWASPADNQSFADKLEANQYDWAEIATGGFEVHSRRDKIIQSIANEKWGGTAEGLAKAVMKYTSNYPHVLAGFEGDGVDEVAEIHEWANSKGLSMETIDKMKHMNADQATCGYGCSGNPYDAYWAFNPIGHGDIHEMGHSMQMMRFEGFPNHAATNTFSFYTKSRYYENTGIDPDCGSLPFKSLFETVQGAVGKTDRLSYLKTNLWDKAGFGEQYLLKIEAMMHAQKMGKVQNGWHVLARVHILQREMKRAKKDWETRKASLGFSNYSLDEINQIRNNDWLVIAYSYAAELDYTNYFDMMGIPYSQKARQQVSSFGFDVVPNSLFMSTPKGYCMSDQYGSLLDKKMIPVDGKSVWAE